MKLIATKDAAKQLGISIWRIHQLIRAGRLPAQKIGSQYVINAADLKLIETRKPGRPSKKTAE